MSQVECPEWHDRVEHDDEFPEPDASWRLFKATAWRGCGRHCTMEILRPKSWLDLHGVQVGAVLPFNIQELGFDGFLEITAVDPCPGIEPGPGRVVLSTFAHENYHELFESELETGDVVVGTASHPFWSEDRSAFVPLGDLDLGERLRTHDGETAVLAIRPHGKSAWIYNLEVHGEHCYELGEAGIVVHNQCGWKKVN